MRTAGNERLVGKNKREGHQVALAEASALEAPQHDESGVHEQLRRIMRARHVLEPPLRRDSVGVGGGDRLEQDMQDGGGVGGYIGG